MAKLTSIPEPARIRELGQEFNGFTMNAITEEDRAKALGYVNRHGGPGVFRVTPLAPRTDIRTA